MWQELWPHVPPPAPGHEAQILVPGGVPGKFSGPNRLAFVAVGLGAGLLLGVLVAFAVAQPKRMLWLAACAAGGAAVALVAAFQIPDRYTSTAVIRLLPPMFPERPSGAAFAASMGERFQRVQQAALSRANLAEIIQEPLLDLYKNDRARKPLEEVAEKMRTQDLAIRMLSPPAASPDSSFSLSISFSYPDQHKAQRVVQEIEVKLLDRWIQVQEAMLRDAKPGDEIAELSRRHLYDNLEILDPASYPSAPVAPNRSAFTTGGMGLGLLIGVLAPRLRRQKLQTA